MPSDSNTTTRHPDGFHDFSINEAPEDLFGLTALSLIGRDGGDANGGLDPTPIEKIIRNPSFYGVEQPGQWRNMKCGCPFSKGNYQSKNSGVAFTVHEDGTFVLTCRDKSHKHPQARLKTDANSNDYWVYVLKPEHKRLRSKFPPFDTGSHTEVARMLLKTILHDAEWDGVETLRTYETTGKHAGKWKLWGADVIKEAIRNLEGEWIHLGDNKDGSPKMKKVGVNDGMVTGVFKQIMSTLASGRSRKSQDGAGKPLSVFHNHTGKTFIPLKGSIFDLQTDLPVLPHQSASKYYYSRAEDALPCGYWGSQPEAPNLFLSMLETAWGAEGDYFQRVSFLQEWVGVALAGEATKHETHVLLKGVAHAGKSQVIKVIEGLFPKSAVAHVEPQNLASRFALANFRSARLNTVADVEPAYAPSGKMKALQSGDSVEIEKKGKDAECITPRAAFLFGCNQSWRPSEKHSSVYRRWKVLTFNQPVAAEKKVAGLAEMILRDELQQIVAWAAEGYRRFKASGFKFTHFPSSDEAIHEWRRDVDPTLLWLEESVEISEQHSTPAKTHYSAYKDWAVDNGYKPVSSAKFGLEIKEHGVSKKRTKKGMVHLVRLIPNADTVPDLEAIGI